RSSEYKETDIPTVHNLIPMLNNQSQYIHHLETEVNFCKEELSGMKYRVQVVVLENERLQQELKSQRQEEAVKLEQTLLDASGYMQNSWITTGEYSGVDEAAKRQFSHGNVDIIKVAPENLKLELEKLKLIYEERTETLESQLKFLRKDLAECQKRCEDLKGQLKHKESLLAANSHNSVGGLCLKCAQHEAVISKTHNNVHMQTIERLTKERDDLMSALVCIRSSLTDVQQREASAYEQVDPAYVGASTAMFFFSEEVWLSDILGKIGDFVNPDGKRFLDKQAFSVGMNGLLSGDNIKLVHMNSNLPLDSVVRVWTKISFLRGSLYPPSCHTPPAPSNRKNKVFWTMPILSACLPLKDSLQAMPSQQPKLHRNLVSLVQHQLDTTKSELSVGDKMWFDKIFLKTDLDLDRNMSGQGVKEIFIMLVGRLSKDEFTLAIQQVSKGTDPPQVLSLNMFHTPRGPIPHSEGEKEEAIRKKANDIQKLQNYLDKGTSSLPELKVQKQDHLDEMNQRDTAGVELPSWEGPVGNHHQVPEIQARQNQPGKKHTLIAAKQPPESLGADLSKASSLIDSFGAVVHSFKNCYLATIHTNCIWILSELKISSNPAHIKKPIPSKATCSRALIQCEQLKNELERQTERLKKELATQQEKRAFEKEIMKKEITKERKDMGSKMLILSQNIAQLETEVEKAMREKISAINQLEEIQKQLASQEMEVTKVCGEIRYQLNKTKLEKDEAEKEHREYRTKTKRNLEIKDQVRDGTSVTTAVKDKN
ncbi:LOW QUALITY PROTEIN: Serologically defined colon cancer antigen 8, partial [Galemys pyrenaicus]